MRAVSNLSVRPYEDYLGAWTLVSYGSAIVGEKGYQFTETPLQFNVRIEKDVEGQSYKVYGWNADTEFANANPFIMNYDPKETEGIGGWLNIPLAQVVKTEGNIDWTLCPRFLSGETYYYYTNTDMDKAFIGAREKEGAVVIQGGQYEFTGGIGVVQILSMNFMGIDKDNPKGEAKPGRWRRNMRWRPMFSSRVIFRHRMPAIGCRLVVKPLISHAFRRRLIPLPAFRRLLRSVLLGMWPNRRISVRSMADRQECSDLGRLPNR